jgi:FKBP-type peptidyl-prolyl cis-trans isomerase
MHPSSLPRTLCAVLLAAVFPFLIPVSAAQEKPPAKNGNGTKEVVTASGLKYVDLKAGQGEEARAGKVVEVHYTGWLENGTKFDSSVDRNRPFTFRLGAGDVIKGWDEGVAGMKAGGKRKLIIPPDLGYGKRGAGEVIPPGATLIFEVELLGVR